MCVNIICKPSDVTHLRCGCIGLARAYPLFLLETCVHLLRVSRCRHIIVPVMFEEQ